MRNMANWNLGIPNDLMTVSELNRLSRLALEKTLPSCRVGGEISNFNRAASGHWYFTLKDATSSVRAVMFRTRNQFVDWVPQDGDHVEVRAQPTLYEARGDYQLQVDALRKAGQGLLFEAFLKLKEKLEREGLFDPTRKRTAPALPKCIGVITSPQAAALRDVLSTLAQRWPLSKVIVYPTQVQGEGAAPGIVKAIGAANRSPQCDVLLLVRGGGSIEDLHAFNDEAVARAISASRLTIISGVGHETDFTIADFVADLRAPTPTGAAQLATPSRSEKLDVVLTLDGRARAAMTQQFQTIGQALDGFTRRLRHPAERIQIKRQQLANLQLRSTTNIRERVSVQSGRLMTATGTRQKLTNQILESRHAAMALKERLCACVKNDFSRHKTRTQLGSEKLSLLNPSAVLNRGYCILRNDCGEIVRNAEYVTLGERISAHLGQGVVESKVTKVIR